MKRYKVVPAGGTPMFQVFDEGFTEDQAVEAIVEGVSKMDPEQARRNFLALVANGDVVEVMW